MTEIEPTIENVREGDVVTLELGTPGEPGHTMIVYRIDNEGEDPHGVTMTSMRKLTADNRRRITRITRPAPPIPDELGERFWARYESTAQVEEFVVTRRNGEVLLVSLHDGLTWTPEEHGDSFTVVPAPEPETVPVPADLIREAERWDALPIQSSDVGVGILTRIVQAARDREGES